MKCTTSTPRMLLRLLPLSQPDPSVKVPLRGRLYQAILILAVTVLFSNQMLSPVIWMVGTGVGVG